MDLFGLITAIVLVAFGGFLFGLTLGTFAEKHKNEKRIKAYQYFLKQRARTS